jgi:hypothetical protein
VVSSWLEEAAERAHRVELTEALGADEFARACGIGRTLMLGQMLDLALGRVAVLQAEN